MIIYRGPSLLDGAPIVVIAQPSWNKKTGHMLGTWIIREDVLPSKAAYNGLDSAICGDCKYRAQEPKQNGFGWVDGSNLAKIVKRSCYVRTDWDADVLYRRMLDDEFPDWSEQPRRGTVEWANWCGRINPYRMPVRIGSYGDPAVVPVHVWRQLVTAAYSFTGYTGYTHLWRRDDLVLDELKEFCMASVDSLEEREEAQAAGWRTFFVGDGHEDDVLCPASKEAGRKTTCENCVLCMGTASTSPKSIWIPAHGPGKHLIQVENMT